MRRVYLQVDLRGSHTRVPEQFQDGHDISAMGQQVRGKLVARQTSGEAVGLTVTNCRVRRDALSSSHYECVINSNEEPGTFFAAYIAASAPASSAETLVSEESVSAIPKLT
jgi:hypothetical protein